VSVNTAAGNPDVRLSAVLQKKLRFSPSGMQLIAEYRISSLDFRSTQSRHLKLAGHYSILRAGCPYLDFYKNNH